MGTAPRVLDTRAALALAQEARETGQGQPKCGDTGRTLREFTLGFSLLCDVGGMARTRQHSTTPAQQTPMLPMEYDAHLMTMGRKLTIHSIVQPGSSVKPKYGMSTGLTPLVGH